MLLSYLDFKLEKVNNKLIRVQYDKDRLYKFENLLHTLQDIAGHSIRPYIDKSSLKDRLFV